MYAGLQSRTQCFCGNQFGRHGPQRGEVVCNMPCPASVHEMCGDLTDNSIYRTGLFGNIALSLPITFASSVVTKNVAQENSN